MISRVWAIRALVSVAILVLAGLALPGVARAQTQATIQATIQIAEPLAIISSTQVDFGQVVPGQTDGTVTVTTSNQRIVTGGVETQGSEFSRAEFSIQGEPGASYSIDVPELRAQPLGVDDEEEETPGLPSLEVTNIKSSSTTVGAETRTGQIGPDGTDTVFVGGTLVIPANAKAGRYRLDVEVSLNY